MRIHSLPALGMAVAGLGWLCGPNWGQEVIVQQDVAMYGGLIRHHSGAWPGLQECWQRWTAHLRPDAPTMTVPSMTSIDVGPPPVAPRAKCADEGNYVGDYVGGGYCGRGSGPGPEEGTWGWDYCFKLSRYPFLCWINCRYQGGTGAYKTDGPHGPPPPPKVSHRPGCEGTEE